MYGSNGHQGQPQPTRIPPPPPRPASPTQRAPRPPSPRKAPPPKPLPTHTASNVPQQRKSAAVNSPSVHPNPYSQYASPQKPAAPRAHPHGAASATYAIPPPAVHSPYTYTPSTATPNHVGATSHSAAQKSLQSYKHNTIMAFFLLPTICCILASHNSPYPTILAIMSALLLYALDLANQRSALVVALWCLVPVHTMVNGWFWLLETDSEETTVSTDTSSGWVVLGIIFCMGLTVLLLICLVCFLTLQLPSTTGRWQIEVCLHSVVPTVVGAFASHYLVDRLVVLYGMDVATTAAPLVLAVCLTIGMLVVGASHSSFRTASETQQPNEKKEHDDSSSKAPVYCISNTVAFGHVAVLLTVPPAMHFLSFYPRIVSNYASADDWWDWLLSFTVPYLLMTFMGILHHINLRPSPYGELRFIKTQTSSLIGIASTTSGSPSGFSTLFPMGAAVVSSIAAQQRYLIPAIHRLSYMFMGVTTSSTVLSLYWTLATLSFLVAMWIWGRKSTVNGELLFGEYQEDIVQLLLALSGMTIGKGVGMPWNFTPLPILAFLGLSLWLSTRMLRYLAIFLFVVHATVFVAFTYRFAGITQQIELAFPRLKVELLQFTMLVVASSTLVGVVAGLAVRSTGGFLSQTLKKIDLTGCLLIIYSLFLIDLELSLFKRDAPTSELSGLHSVDADGLREGSLYSFERGILTSVALASSALFMKHVRIIKSRTAGTVLSLSLGKSVMFYAESVCVQLGIFSDVTFVQTVVVSVIFMVLFTPSVLFSPVHLKTSTRYKRSMAGDSSLPPSVSRTLVVYNLLVVPAILLVAAECLYPVYYAFLQTGGASIAISTWMMCSIGLALWSVASLSMMTQYLPDGGGEIWKRCAALMFLLALASFFLASPLRTTNIDLMMSNPYVVASSIGGRIQSRSKRRSGVWGVSAAVLATILALTGVLELKEKRNRSGMKDRYYMFRTMLFGLLFGGGVTWFVVVQIMAEAELPFLIMTMIASVTMASLGTICAVLGHLIELEHFSEAEELGKTWMLALPVFMLIANLPQLFSKALTRPFEPTWTTSTYLTVCGLTSFALAVSYRTRERRDARSAGQTNLFCLFAWLCTVAVIFGRSVVGGLDADLNTTEASGSSTAVVGNVVASLILLALEPPVSGGSKRMQTTTSSRSTSPFLSLPCHELNSSNRIFPLYFCTCVVLLLASLYSILLRGCWVLDALGGDSTRAERFFEMESIGLTSVNKALGTLAKETIRGENALKGVVGLSQIGFWTSDSLVTPLMHLAATFTAFPTLFLCTNKFWFNRAVSLHSHFPTPSSQSVGLVSFAATLNVFPFIYCSSLSYLRSAALLNMVAGGYHALSAHKSIKMSNMEL